MAFFQDLGKKISSVTQDAAKKTSDLIEITKLNSAINAEKSAIAELHKKIGATVYSLYTTGEQIPDALSADVQGITARLQTIAGLENKIADIKAEEEKAKASETAQTPAPTPAQAAPAAPAPAPEEPAGQPAGDTRFCTACGSPLEPGMIYCSKCGAKNA